MNLAATLSLAFAVVATAAWGFAAFHFLAGWRRERRQLFAIMYLTACLAAVAALAGALLEWGVDDTWSALLSFVAATGRGALAAGGVLVALERPWQKW